MQTIVREFERFENPEVTADGQPRAHVAPRALTTVWFNTGTLCNLACENCYIESSPSNDRLSYLTRADVAGFLEEIEQQQLPVREIGITGGEPFMNPDILEILADCLQQGFRVLVLTNAMRPMMKCANGLERLAERYGGQLVVRVSIDHFEQVWHEEERGPRSWRPTMEGLVWLSRLGLELQVAGRTRWGDSEAALRAGFQQLFDAEQLGLDVGDHLVLFPEMDEASPVPEITVDCWHTLGVDPDQMMCASARMVVRRKGALAPEVVACTLLPYDEAFSLAGSLVDSLVPVALNHPHCARFCVLGGGSCSG